MFDTEKMIKVDSELRTSQR